MKRFWLVLLSLGLVMAFSVSALAVDVKVGAEYYAAGVYLNKTSVADGRLVGYPYWWSQRLTPSDDPNPSTAFFYQRLRVGTDFIVSPCLKLVTRFDAMERIWGGQRSEPGDSDPNSAGTRAENENIAFDVTYIDYASPVGVFQVGYMPDYTWGTVFANKANGPTAGQIKYTKHIGQIDLVLGYAKEADNSYSAVHSSQNDTDQDYDSYRLGGIYNFKNNKVSGEAGLLLVYERDATFKADENFVVYMGPMGGLWYRSFLKNSYKVNPYAKVKIGPVDLQAELLYNFGDAYKWEDVEAYSSAPAFLRPANVSMSTLSVFLDATANLGMFYAGGSFAYLSGDDPGTKDKVEGGINTAGLDWNPCLILFNNDVVSYWAGGISGQGGPLGNNRTQVGGPMSNAWFGQLRGGVKPTPQLDIMMSLSYAKADKNMHNKTYFDQAPNWAWANYPGTSYGFEVDVIGTYKITNNLFYMLGAGYLFTGDYYKGYDQAGRDYKVVDDFMFINKLTLNF